MPLCLCSHLSERPCFDEKNTVSLGASPGRAPWNIPISWMSSLRPGAGERGPGQPLTSRIPNLGWDLKPAGADSPACL